MVELELKFSLSQWHVQHSLPGMEIFLGHTEKRWVCSGRVLALGKLFRAQGSSGAQVVSFLWGLSFFVWDCSILSLVLAGQSSLELLVQRQEAAALTGPNLSPLLGSVFNDTSFHDLLVSHRNPASGQESVLLQCHQLCTRPGLVRLL